MLTVRFTFVSLTLLYIFIYYNYSTRSPRAVPYNLLESSSLTVLHAFNSQDWLMCVQHALALDSATAQELPFLDNGQALLCCPKVRIFYTNPTLHF
jgi:hypothetical protein